jgi:maleate isomerase
MLTPYPEWLQAYAEEYWSRSGVEVVAVERVDIGSEDTYKIYDLEAEDAMPGFLRLLSKDCGAVLISGTGMPSLKLINNNETNGKKVISSNYAMARIGLSYLGIESRTKSEWF